MRISAKRTFQTLVTIALAVSACSDKDNVIDATTGGSGGSSGAGSGGSGQAGGGGSAGRGGSAGMGGGAGAGMAGSSSGGSGGGSSGSGGTAGTSSTTTDAGVVDAGTTTGDAGSSVFNCPPLGGANGDPACNVCETQTQLTECQPVAECPDNQRGGATGTGCETQYAAFLSCMATEPVSAYECVGGNPSIKFTLVDFGGTPNAHACGAQECAFYLCLGVVSSCP